MFRRYSKYNAKKVEIDGIKFDSKAEGDYYLHLKQQVTERQILGFERQKRMLLQEGFNVEGVKGKIRPIFYVVDFIITENDGTLTYVDVKGMETDVFKLKKKLFMKRYNTALLKVKKTKGGWQYE
jgi:hypothetical protein